MFWIGVCPVPGSWAVQTAKGEEKTTVEHDFTRTFGGPSRGTLVAMQRAMVNVLNKVTAVVVVVAVLLVLLVITGTCFINLLVVLLVEQQQQQQQRQQQQPP